MNFFANYTELDALGVKHNTNKSSSWVRPDGTRESKPEGSLVKYEFFLEKIRHLNDLRILELGAGPDVNIGASVRVWKDYFPTNAEIHVADIKESASALQSEGFKTHIGDLGSSFFVQELAKLRWNFVLDDASHIWFHQILAFRTLFPSICSSGIFIAEDLCTSFGKYRPNYSMGYDMKDSAAYFLALSRAACSPETVNEDDALCETYRLSPADKSIVSQIHMISWIHNSCIIIKR